MCLDSSADFVRFLVYIKFQQNTQEQLQISRGAFARRLAFFLPSKCS